MGAGNYQEHATLTNPIHPYNRVIFTVGFCAFTGTATQGKHQYSRLNANRTRFLATNKIKSKEIQDCTENIVYGCNCDSTPYY